MRSAEPTARLVACTFLSFLAAAGLLWAAVSTSTESAELPPLPTTAAEPVRVPEPSGAAR
ncbi:hypothetical protein [Saccharopolyspora sp. NPDC003762]